MYRPVLVLYLLFMGCTSMGQLTYITELPKKLEENSGIVKLKDATLWVIEDGGNKDEIYKVDFEGNLLKQFKVKNAANHDWEDLTKDGEGNVYIGDFGNNANDRKNLVIYKIPNPELEKGDKIEAEKIEFNYPEQKDFPPRKDKLYYDAEAFFYHANFLYVITKNRAKPFPGNAMIYKVPAQPGTHDAAFMGTFKTCDDWKTCQITSADISPNGKTIVFLSYGKLWVVTNFDWDDFSQGTIEEIDLGVRTQLESVCFIDNTTLLLSDEERGPTGGNLYQFKL